MPCFESFFGKVIVLFLLILFEFVSVAVIRGNGIRSTSTKAGQGGEESNLPSTTHPVHGGYDYRLDMNRM